MDAVRQRLFVRRLFGVVGGLFVAFLVLARGEAPVRPGVLALVGGRIVTQTDAGTVEGTVLVRDGKIVGVGPAVTVPDDAERIDVTGCVITPGLIDARSTLWLTSAAAREGAADGGLDVLDGVDPHEEDWKEVVRQGVTTVYVQPAATGVFGGRGAVLRVGPAASTEELVVKAGAAAQAALGISAGARPTGLPTLPGRFGNDPPIPLPAQPAAPSGAGTSLARYSQYEQLKRAFEAAKKYDDDWKKAEDADKAKKPGDKPSTKPKRDGTKDFLRKVLNGEVPLRLEAQREDDIRNALRLADEFKIRLVLDGVSNPGTASADLVNRRVPLVLGPFVELDEPQADRPEQPAAPTGRRGQGRRRQPTVVTPPPAARADQPVERTKAQPAEDTRWALGTFSSQPRGSRLLRVHAAAAVASGIDSDRVLRAMTRDAADILGVSDRLGTVAAGKQADLAVFAGDPLDPSVPVRLVVSGGKVVYQADVKPDPTRHSPLATRHSPLPLPARLPKKYALKTENLILEDGKTQSGIVVVDDGKVVAVGPAVSVSDGTPTYDLGYAVVTPGLVAGHTHLGLASAIDDPAEADAGHVRAADVFDPQHRQVRELLEAGFTSVVHAPGSVNVIAGTCSGLRLASADSPLGDAGMKFVLTASSRGTGRSATDLQDDPFPGFPGRARGPARYPASLAGQVELIEQVLSGKAPETELYLPRAIRQNIQAERRRQVTALLERKQVAFIEAHTRAEVDAALQLIARFKLRGVLVGPEEFKPFLDEIKRLGVGIVARPVRADDYDRLMLELTEAANAGVPVAFGSAPANELRMTAALAVNAGIQRETAWRGLTTGAGQMAGVPESTGRLVVGGPADLVVWDGSPLDLRSRPVRVIADGKAVLAAP